MVGGDGANEHNARYARMKFVCKDRTTLHGIAGYFESVLYESQDGPVELSTRPDTIDFKSKDMMSWFPIYFPLKVRCIALSAVVTDNIARIRYMRLTIPN